jgi:hypothetical protein
MLMLRLTSATDFSFFGSEADAAMLMLRLTSATDSFPSSFCNCEAGGATLILRLIRGILHGEQAVDASVGGSGEAATFMLEETSGDCMFSVRPDLFCCFGLSGLTRCFYQGKKIYSA